MSPFKVPSGSPLKTDKDGRTSCMALSAALRTMGEDEQLRHLEAHYETCEDGPEFYEFCPICVPLRRAYEQRADS